MTKFERSGLSNLDAADKRSAKAIERDIRKSNESAKFAAFVHEYRVDCGHYDATMAEIIAAYERSK